MRQTDIAVVGGGLAGSTAAAMLGRAGHRAVLIDPRTVYPPEFRCEKLDVRQIRLLHETGLADAVHKAATLGDELSVVRFGHLVDKGRSHQYGILYDSLVMAVRGAIPQGTQVIHAKVAAVSTSADRQCVVLSNGEAISTRLIVLANGLNFGLRRGLGMTREALSTCHSIAIGFDAKPIGRRSFEFRSLTYYPERTAARTAYIALFAIGSTTRANLFVYRDMSDPWLSKLRQAPEENLFATLPGLEKFTGKLEVTGLIKIRPVDLYVTRGYRQPGIVLVGDAFATSCPAAGTGVSKVFTDVTRLCNVYIPGWLATQGMGEEKISAFYDDPVKKACDSESAAMAYYVRSLSIDAAVAWRVRRWGKFIGQFGVGTQRHAREQLSIRSVGRRGAAVGSGAGS